MARHVALIALTLAGLAPAGRSAPEPAFDIEAATEAYLARIPPEQKARSDAYFEGGYWLQFCEALASAGICLLLLETRWSARMRDLAERFSSRGPVVAFLYWAQYLAIATVLLFPLTVYEGFVREHRYGLSNQHFAAWFADEVKGLLISIVLGGLLMAALFAIVRRLRRTWWIWGAAVTVLFLAVGITIYPLFIAPLFNRYTRLADERVREPILRIARANGIGVGDVYQVDASRQTRRISANVSGFLGTERITLNDNLLRRCTLEEIQAVVAHEVGHYVLNHVQSLLALSAALSVAAFAFLRWGLEWPLRKWGARWRVRGIDDVAVLPLAVLLITGAGFVLTPAANTYSRAIEHEADLFGLNAARQPDAFADVALKLGEYRKLDPSPLEEALLYDHPSGRTRIFTAMRWKAAMAAQARDGSRPQIR